MEKQHFDFYIIRIERDFIVVRVTSSEKVKLVLMRGKFLPYDEHDPTLPLSAAFLDSNNRYKDFCYDYSTLQNKTGFSIIVKDETNREQYSIGVGFEERKINIRQMMYGE